MPSREMRRATRKKNRDLNIAERRKESHPFLYAFSVGVLVLIVVTFIGGPALSRAGSRGRIIFGYYRRVPIEYYPGNFFSQRKDLIADQLRGSDQNTDIETKAYQVWRTAFDQTVFHTAILFEAKASGLWISEDKVDEALISSGPYTVDGTFSEERYKATPSAERMSYRKLYREQLIHQQYLDDVLQAQRVSDKEEGFVASMVDEQRRFSFVSFPFTSYPEQQIKKYAQDNRKLFRRIKVSRILIKSSEREAEEIRKKLADRTGSFEELARAHSKDLYAEKGGDMGWRYFYDLQADFEDPAAVETVFGLEETEISPVLESRFGWVIFRCDSPALEPDLEDPDTLKVVRDYVLKYEKGMVEDYLLSEAGTFRERIDEVGFLGATLEDNVAVGVTDYFPINYQSFYLLAPVRSPMEQFNLSSAASSEDFFVQAFSLTPGQVSAPILLADQVIILQLDDIRRPPQRELDLVDDFYQYFAQAAIQQDLQNVLLNPDYIQDDFNDTFYRYVYTKQ